MAGSVEVGGRDFHNDAGDDIDVVEGAGKVLDQHDNDYLHYRDDVVDKDAVGDGHSGVHCDVDADMDVDVDVYLTAAVENQNVHYYLSYQPVLAPCSSDCRSNHFRVYPRQIGVDAGCC
mmetsp:Transcript_14465/g.30390  ORF Transcript_14465/g.30390 Transcript_14465/m.30390 type:complete len:119 (+) Transcript_14465:438-794(+)